LLTRPLLPSVGPFVEALQESSMSLTEAEITILRAIACVKPISSDQATWAVKEGYAVQAEDADIDLTPAGREIVERAGGV